jgi:predicted RNA binding protein YcfA (HicA-like mRNA interferase family)
MTGKQLIKLAAKNGWKKDRQRGSHVILKKDEKIVSIPLHNKDLGKGILNNLLKQLKIKLE